MKLAANACFCDSNVDLTTICSPAGWGLGWRPAKNWPWWSRYMALKPSCVVLALCNGVESRWKVFSSFRNIVWLRGSFTNMSHWEFADSVFTPFSVKMHRSCTYVKHSPPNHHWGRKSVAPIDWLLDITVRFPIIPLIETFLHNKNFFVHKQASFKADYTVQR